MRGEREGGKEGGREKGMSLQQKHSCRGMTRIERQMRKCKAMRIKMSFAEEGRG